MNIPTGGPSTPWRTLNAVIIGLLALTPRSAAESRPMAPGLWGGDHIRMTIGRAGARLEYDCADSTIDQPIILDANGRFTAKGSYAPAHGGPRREGQDASNRARYVGEV